MSFWTDVIFVRPTQPPKLSVSVLMSFTRAILQTGITESQRPRRVKLKLGQAIDADRQDTTTETIVMPGIVRVSEIGWDIDSESTTEMELLAEDTRQVYRAWISFDFGSLRPSISNALRTSTDGERPNLLFGDVSIQCGMVTAGGLETERVQVGWMGVGFGGQGYLWPWEPADLLQRIHADPHLAAVERVCRSMFPVTHAEPIRKKWWDFRAKTPAQHLLGDHWPFTTRWPNDWAWAIQESG